MCIVVAILKSDELFHAVSLCCTPIEDGRLGVTAVDGKRRSDIQMMIRKHKTLTNQPGLGRSDMPDHGRCCVNVCTYHPCLESCVSASRHGAIVGVDREGIDESVRICRQHRPGSGISLRPRPGCCVNGLCFIVFSPYTHDVEYGLRVPPPQSIYTHVCNH